MALVVAAILLSSLPIASASPTTPAACAFQVMLAATPSYGPTPLVVQFNATVSSGTPLFYDWSFGDGSSWNDTTHSSSDPFHRYASVGQYSANVTVGEAGCNTVARTTVTAVAGPLRVVILASPSSGSAPLSVTFNATATGGTGTYASAVWNFGDGGLGSGLALVYTYARPGVFTAVLNVTDSAGDSSEATVVVSVSGDSGPAGGVPAITYLVIGLIAAGVILFVGFRRLSLSRMAPRTGGGDSLPPPGAVGVGGHTTPSGASGGEGPPPGSLGPDLPGTPAAVARSDRPAPSDRSSAVRTPPKTTSPLRRETLRTSERVLLHIGRQGALRADDVAPAALTQAGMAEALGVGQNSLTNVLRRLTAAGVLGQELRHVRGRPRRLRVYTLTGRGESLYRELRSRSPPPPR